MFGINNLQLSKEAFRNTSMVTVRFVDCNLMNFPEVGLLGATLRTLYLTDNHIQAIPAEIISHLTVLNQLDLTNNKITHLTNLTHIADTIVTLELSKNEIVSVSALSSSTRFPSLITLGLSHNKISKISISRILSNSPTLNMVTLNNNLLESLDEPNHKKICTDAVLKFDKGVLIVINENPFNCDMNLKWMIEQATENEGKISSVPKDNPNLAPIVYVRV